MADQGLKIVIGAEVGQAVQGLNQLDSSLNKLGNSADLSKIEKELDALQKKGVLSFGAINIAIKGLQDQLKSTNAPAEIAKINTAIAALQARAKQLKPPGGFDDFTQKSNAATQALTNLGRVAQDVPFGFIGIANNLNPLLESFQRLRAASGSTSAAISALGTSLLGAGGIGIAISVISAAASFAAIGMQAWGGSLFGASKETEALEKKTDDLKTAIQGAFESTAQEAARVTALTAILRNETETRQRRIAAIKELKDIQPEIFAGLKLEGDAVIGLDGAYKQYLERLNLVVAAKIKQAQLEQKIAELLQLQGATLTRSEKVFAGFGKEFSKNLQAASDSLNRKGLGDGVNLFVKTIQDAEKKTQSAISGIQNDIDGLTKDLIELSPGIEVKIPDAKKIKEAFEPLKVGIVKGLNDFANTIDLQPSPLSTLFQQLVDDSANSLKFSSVKKALEDKLNFFSIEISNLKLKSQITIDPNLTLPPGIRDEKIAELASQFASGTPLKIDGLTVELDKTKLRQQLQTQVSDAIAGMGADTFANFGDILGDALSGEGLKGAFENFGKIISQGLSSIGKALIKAGTLALLAKTALSKIFSNPALAIGVGVALVALSRVISNSFAGAREKGGPVQRGLKYLVNERGKELFVPNHGSPAWIEGGTRGFTPPTSGRIIPAWQAKAFAAKFQIPKFQDGGLITGPTFGLLGEGSGINSINPEVVAPLASLKSLLGDGLRQNINVNVTGRLRNRDIRLGQSREGRSQNRTANG